MQHDRQPVILVDLIRCGCAMMVVLYHYGAAFWLGPTHGQAALLAGAAAPGWQRSAAIGSGWIGVELFFVVSGMVIARSAAGAEAGAFLRRRLLRLVPALWICASLTALVLAVAAPDAGLPLRWVRSVAFWPWGEPIDGSYWTIGIELSFYALSAAALRLGRRGAHAVGDLLTLAAIGFWPAMRLLGDAAVPFAFSREAALLLLPHGCFFALGIALARAEAEGWRRGVAARVALLIPVCLVEIAAHATERSTAFHQPVGSAMPVALFLGGVMLLALARRLQAPLARLVRPGAARTLGIVTYPLYLLHQEIGAVLIARTAPVIGTIPAIVLAAALVVALAWSIATRAEPALRSLLAGAWRPRRATLATAR